MRNQPPPNDPDILTLLNSPAEVGHKRITVGDMCVRRYRDRQHRCEPDWHVKVRLRQLLETGRYRASPPHWVPPDLPVWDGYVELKGGEELVGLTRDRNAPRTFNAATWYRRECLGWRVAPDTDDKHLGVIRVEPATHTVIQYIERIAGDCNVDAARAELRAVIRCARVLPEAPTWFDDYTYGGVPAYWLIIDDWLVFPLVPSTRPCPDMYVAVTCLYRDMPHSLIDLPDLQTRLHRESVRLHRDEILRHVAARKAA
jgi:hypothetical protein